MTLNITLEAGSHHEVVTVTSTTPLLDRKGQVGGHIGAADLTGLPTSNRSSFAALGLLPGIQFVATNANEMGNDTIVANGQSAETNNISVDGAYNADDSTGTTFGGQVRTPLEAIQEIQVVTSQYGAEHGRAGGAIVNVITKPGTNSFSGVSFAYTASHWLTARDFFVQQANLPEARTSRREWGFVFGGPVVPNKAHFFVSLERQVNHPTRTQTFPTQPSLNYSIVEDQTTWNTLVRFDHQINAGHRLGGPLASRRRTAASHRRTGCDSGNVRRRDRSRSDGGCLPDERIRTLTGQHIARRADLGALLARQRMLSRPGGKWQVDGIRLRTRG